MRRFILGIATGLALAIIVALVAGMSALMYVEQGFVDPRADIAPSRFEKKHAMEALDAALDRHAPKLKDPVKPTESNLAQGAKLYETYCAQCHGAIAGSGPAVRIKLYPPAPQFPTEPVDMEEFENYYVIKHGVRWTGMPAWRSELSETEIWTVVTFLNQTKKPMSPMSGMTSDIRQSAHGDGNKGGKK